MMPVESSIASSPCIRSMYWSATSEGWSSIVALTVPSTDLPMMIVRCANDANVPSTSRMFTSLNVMLMRGSCDCGSAAGLALAAPAAGGADFSGTFDGTGTAGTGTAGVLSGEATFTATSPTTAFAAFPTRHATNASDPATE